MKKLFFIFVLVFCLAAGFAETGYAGTPWGTLKQNLKIGDRIAPTDNALWESTEARKKLILNRQNTVYYHFFENQLYGVSYTLQAEDTKQICAKFTNKVDILKVPATTKEEWIDNLIAQRMIDNKEDNALINLASNKMIFEVAAVFEFYGNQAKKTGDAKIYIYDYNEDTRVYIFENMVEGLTFVTYMWHEQDF
jgi:hypothetical protein